MGKKNHSAAPYMCGQCKQGFAHERAVRDHITDAHPTIRNCGVFRCIDRVAGPSYEPSYGERAVDAELARAMGEHSDDDWLLP